MLEPKKKITKRSLRRSAIGEAGQFLRRIIGLLWQSSRWWTLLTAVLFAAETASALATLYLLKRLIEALTRLAREGSVALDGGVHPS